MIRQLSHLRKKPCGMSRWLVMAMSLVVLGALSAPTAFAHRQDHGGKWPSSNYTYYMNLNGHTWYADNVIRPAAANWGQNTKFNIGEAAATSAQVSVTVDTYLGDWFGDARPGPDKTCCTYTYGYVKINHNLTKDLSERHKRTVTVHEMGHVIGLSHNDIQSIMNRSGSALFYTYNIVNPQPHDTNDVANIY